MSTERDHISELLSPTGPLFIQQMIYKHGELSGMTLKGQIEDLGEKPVPVLLRPPEIPHGITLARIRASMEKPAAMSLSHSTA
jgi:hypothetical protein